MAQIATTREQSKKLQELGITADTADMFYPLGSSFPEVCDNEDNLQADCPAWSLGALIGLLPSEIKSRNRKKYFKLEHERVSYFDKDEIYGFSFYVENNLFDACVSMIERLVKHKKLKFRNY